MAKITFNVGEGGLGRALAGKDYYSGFLFDSATYPSGFSSSEPIHFLGSLSDAENLGIVNDGTGETVATGGEVEVTAVGASGDVIDVYIQSTHGEPILLAEVIEGASETVDSLAARIAQEINATTLTHGFTAAATLGVISLTMPANQGAAYNGAGLSATSSGTATFTVTQFTGGVGSPIALMHYHISEFFRIQPRGFLWFGVYDCSSGLDSDYLKEIQVYAGGDIRQMAYYTGQDFSSTDMGTIQTAINELQADYMYMNGVYGADLSGETLSGLPDMRLLGYNRVSACIGQDGGNEGWRLFDVMGYSVTCIGACLGAIALAQVHEDIGWPVKFNLAGTELDSLSFATGDLNANVSTATLELLTARGYVFALKYVGKSGSFFNDSPVATDFNSDYAYIENGRTIDKAIRATYASLVNYLNSPIYVDPDTGELSELTIADWKNTASLGLEEMLVDGELSGYDVVIDPDQNVLATSTVELTLKLVPVGVAREIVVNIGYVVSLS